MKKTKSFIFSGLLMATLFTFNSIFISAETTDVTPTETTSEIISDSTSTEITDGTNTNTDTNSSDIIKKPNIKEKKIQKVNLVYGRVTAIDGNTVSLNLVKINNGKHKGFQNRNIFKSTKETLSITIDESILFKTVDGKKVNATMSDISVNTILCLKYDKNKTITEINIKSLKDSDSKIKPEIKDKIKNKKNSK